MSAPSPVSCSIDLIGARQALGHLALPEDHEHGRLGEHLRPHRVDRERRGADRARPRRQPRRRVRGPGRRAPAAPGAAAGAGLGPRDRDPGALARGVEGEHAELALGRELQPLVPRLARTGRANEQLADFLTRVLFPLADVVIDMHSGGRSAWFIPCSHMHVVDDPAQRAAMLEGMEAWNSDWHFLYIDVNGTGLLPVEAENQGKLVITTELGGGGRVPAPVHRLAWSGLTNVLRHVGVLEGEVQTRASLGQARRR